MGQPSLVRRLLLTLVVSLTVVSVLLGAGGAWLINGIVQQTSDSLLGASARAIPETLAEEDGEITLDLPPSALGMLENTERDNIYYSVRSGGALITGYENLAPAPSASLSLDHPVFRDDSFRGQKIRVAAVTRKLPRIPNVIVVEVAETLVSRRELAGRMLLGLAALEAVFVMVTALLVWPATGWSLRPVTKLRAQMERHTGDHTVFQQLSLNGVPLELSGLVGGFNALIEQVDASVAGMRRFTADASHQMRTPLTILRTHLAILQKHQPESSVGKASVADIAHATERLQNLLTGLIVLARADDFAFEPGEVETWLGELARKVVTDCAPLAAKRRIGVRLEAPEQDIAVNAPPLAITEILSNLIENAIRYSQRGGEVTIHVGKADGAPFLEVEDDGPGVPAEDLDRIFQRFYRLPRDQARPGSGLGLSVVQTLSQYLGAHVTAAAGRDGRGLLVTVSFARQVH